MLLKVLSVQNSAMCSKHRSSHSQVLYKIGVFVGQVCNLIEKETPEQVSFCEFHENFQKIYFIEYLRTNDSENIYVSFSKFIINVLLF